MSNTANRNKVSDYVSGVNNASDSKAKAKTKKYKAKTMDLPIQSSIPSGSVNEYQLRFEGKRNFVEIFSRHGKMQTKCILSAPILIPLCV